MSTSPTLNTALAPAFAPTGRLRAAINLGNPVLARTDPTTGQAVGVSVDLAQALADRLSLPLVLQVVNTASQSVEAVTQGQADIGFFAVDPVRGAGIAFTAPYLLIEGTYLVRESSPIVANEQVDRAGHVVVVGQGSAYDLHLSRTLQHASITRASSSQTVVDTFLADGADVAAGVKQPLQADAQRVGGLRLLDGRFMVIQQAMGLPKGRGEVAAAALAEFVEAMKASGYVADSLTRHGITGATVAPLLTAAKPQGC